MEGYSLRGMLSGSDILRGVFATRPPCRLDYIGLSIPRLVNVDDNIPKIKDLYVLDDTPIIDIKPYMAALDRK